jgi:hypothetical protein
VIYESLRTMIANVVRNFARPDFRMSSDDKLREADKLQVSLKEKERLLRLRLYEIQSTPKGELHG